MPLEKKNLSIKHVKIFEGGVNNLSQEYTRRSYNINIYKAHMLFHIALLPLFVPLTDPTDQLIACAKLTICCHPFKTEAQTVARG